MRKLELQKNKYPGALFTFSGLDGSGKSTLIDLASKWLRVHQLDFIVVKQPSKTVRQSKAFRMYIDDTVSGKNHYNIELALFTVKDRIQSGTQEIEPALKRGKIVLCDRYFYCCLAHHIINGYEKDKWIYHISRYILKPDAAFFLDLPAELAMQRVHSRPAEKMRGIDVKRQFQMRETLLRISDCEKGIVLPTNIDIQITQEKMMQQMQQVLSEKKLLLKDKKRGVYHEQTGSSNQNQAIYLSD